MTPSSATGLEQAGVSVKPLEPVRLADCPPGLFLFNGHLGFRSEYATVTATNPAQPDAYVVESGEYFWGGCTTSLDRSDLIVTPLEVMSALTVTSFPAAEQHVVTSHAVPLDDGEGAVASEPYKWEGYWPGAGSIDSITRHTSHKPTAEKWEADGAEVTPLFTHPAPVAAQSPAEGWVLVPREPTEAMLSAFHTGFLQHLGVRKRNRFKPLEKLTVRERESAEQAGMRAMLAASPTPPTAPAVQAGLTDLLNREDIRHALEIARMGRPYSDVQGHLYMNERYKSHPGYDAQFTDYGLAHAACVLFNAADDILRALSALPAQPNSSEGEPT